MPNLCSSILDRSSPLSHSVTDTSPSRCSVSTLPTSDRLPWMVRMLTMRLWVNLESLLVEQYMLYGSKYPSDTGNSQKATSLSRFPSSRRRTRYHQGPSPFSTP